MTDQTTEPGTAARWMIYGANGFTGRIAAREARSQGLSPVLAGRSAAAIQALGAELELETRVFSLDDPAAIAAHLKDIDVVLHCAGPFSATSRPMLEGCIRSRTHYLDITGEIDVFEDVHGRSEQWREAGILAMPGVGFDVVPTDCLAAALRRELPSADRLRLAFKPRHTKLSPGTTKTMIEGLARPSRVRIEGRIVDVPSAGRIEMIPFEGEPEPAVAIPWGDVSTAYYSTAIPNIEVFMSVSPAQIRQMKISRRLGWLLGLAPVQRFLKRRVERTVPGPTDEERSRGDVLLWGEVTDAQGGRVAMKMRTPEGYTFTVDSSLAIVRLVLAGKAKPGAATPSMAFGPDFVLDLPGVERSRVE
ncbi:saccharopine dehydrogenase NADP-binding domain-containing protein [Candidatus Sumerlaeota bacterium]|nr:saccharopine dehydrogenase NADP-binding domain-containing protein [Candidatus Sumerlaeota bacterium]